MKQYGKVLRYELMSFFSLDMLSYINVADRDVCLLVLDYAGLSTNPQDVLELIM